MALLVVCFFFQAEDGIRDVAVTGVQTCALPISKKLLQFASFAFAAFLFVQVLNFYTGIFVGPEGRPNSSGERLIRYLDIGVGVGERPIRVQLFLYAWLMFLSSPLLGIGFGEYAWRAF